VYNIKSECKSECTQLQVSVPYNSSVGALYFNPKNECTFGLRSTSCVMSVYRYVYCMCTACVPNVYLYVY